tara:strand:- start:363 stop:1139 length:777 start_codon:yes stop_codon:yes gene_type:complete
MGKVEDIRARMRGHQAGTNVHAGAALELALAEEDISQDQADTVSDEESMVADTNSAAQQSNIKSIIGGLTTTAKATISAGKHVAAKKAIESAGAAKSAAAGIDTNRPGITGFDKKGWGSAEPPPVTITEDPLYKVGTPSTPGTPGKGLAEPTAAPTASKPTTGASKTEGVFTSDVGASTEAYAKIYRMKEADRTAAIAKLTPSQQQRYTRLISDYEKREGITQPKPIAPKTPKTPKKGIMAGFQSLFSEGIEMGENTP